MDLIFATAKGRFAYYCELPASDDALLVVPLEAAGLVDDSTMAAYENLDDILSGGSNEQTVMGRKLITAGVTSSVVDGERVIEIDDDLTWPGPTGNDVGALVICYVPDVTVGSYLTPDSTRDALAIPLSKHEFDLEPDGEDVVAQFSLPILQAN